MSGLIKDYGKHSVSTDDGGGTWYPMACEFIKLDDHHIHSFFGKEEKSLIEKMIQYIKDKTKSSDDYFPCCRKQNCKLEHIRNNGLRCLFGIITTTLEPNFTEPYC